jgi:hypothetical protein
MTSDLDSQLHTLFTGAEQALPPEAFAAGVTKAVRRHRRRARLLQGAAVLLAAVILWVLSPDVARGAEAAAGLPTAMLRLARLTAHTMSRAQLLPVLYLYVGVFAGYMVLNVLQPRLKGRVR